MTNQRANYIPTIGLELKIVPANVVSGPLHGSYIVRIKYDAVSTKAWRVLPKGSRGGLLVFLSDPVPADGNTLRITSINQLGTAVYAQIVNVVGNDSPADPFADSALAPDVPKS